MSQRGNELIHVVLYKMNRNKDVLVKIVVLNASIRYSHKTQFYSRQFRIISLAQCERNVFFLKTSSFTPAA